MRRGSGIYGLEGGEGMIEIWMGVEGRMGGSGGEIHLDEEDEGREGRGGRRAVYETQTKHRSVVVGSFRRQGERGQPSVQSSKRLGGRRDGAW